jgi:prolyl-tRNA synthetase
MLTYVTVPVVKGRKTENEKFPGALYTCTIESFVEANGRAIQAGTSHALGQNFSIMYGITVEDPSQKVDGEGLKPRLHVWQNSWGLSTRSLGTMLMIHSDDKGAVFPPRCAEFQVAIVPVGLTARSSEGDKQKILKDAESIGQSLSEAGIRVQCDTRLHYSPGWKFNEYELRGFPLRIEFGPKDAEKGVITTVRRDTGEKGIIQISDRKAMAGEVQALLDKMQNEMLKRARKMYQDHIKYTSNWDDVVPLLNTKNVIRMPHCGDGECAELVKEETAELCKTADVDPRAPSMGAKGK